MTTPRAPRRTPPLSVGLDVGGGSVKALAWSGEQPAPTTTSRQRVDGSDRDAVLRAATALVAQVAPADRPLSVGVALPGRIDRQGHVAQSPNLRWLDGAPARQVFADALRSALPMAELTWLGNDATAAAIGEWQAAGDAPRLGLWTVGTGVGGGVVIDGAPLLGARGHATELGHVPVRAGGRPCGCGGRGCLEMYASVTALVARSIELGAEDAPDPRGRGAADEAAGAGVSRITWLSERARAGDAAVSAALRDGAELLGTAMASTAALLGLDVVVVGGGGALLWPVWAPSLQRGLDDACRSLRVGPAPALRAAKVGPAAGALGAAAAARRTAAARTP